MNEQSTLALLSPYIPPTVLRELSRGGGVPLPPVEPLRGATLLLDIAGFTPTVVELSAAGPRGIDALQRLLSSYYTETINVFQELGGIIYQFAGDSILACFELAPGDEDEDAALRAARCAVKVQERLARFRDIELLGKRFAVAAKIGIGFGDSYRILLGSQSRWIHPAIIGRPLESAVAAEKQAAGGEVLVSEDVWRLLPPERVGQPKGSFYRLESVPDVWAPSPATELIADKSPRSLVQQASKLINPLLFKKITTGHQDFIGDFRDVTALFVRFEGLDLHADVARVQRELNPFYEFVQRESSNYGGILLQTDFTDKGNVLFVLFGAPNAQENKEVLASRLAYKLLEEKGRFPFIGQLQVGIATGHAYCGNLGSAVRKGYTTIGEAVNMAARLMTYGSGTGIHVDATTHRKLQHDFVTELVENATLKGLSKPVPVYRIVSEIHRPRTLYVEGKGELIGRKEELRRLRDLAQASFDQGGQVCVVSGEAGIGKSRLASKLVDDSAEYGAVSLYGICYSYEMFTPFFPWRELLTHFFQMLESESREEQLQRLRQALAELEGIGPEWVPVLAGLVGLRVEEDPLTRAVDARRKQQVVFEIIYQLIQRRTQEKPLLLFFEDLHWADKVSIDLLEFVAARSGGIRLMILATTRPGDQLVQLTGLPNFHVVELTHLPREDAREFIRVRSQLAAPSSALEEVILAKSQGNPFFIESIVDGLSEQGYLSPAPGGGMTLTRSVEDIDIPDSIQDVVLARIDLLQEREKAVVKVASVIGRVFALDAVHALLANTVSIEELRDALSTLNRLGLTLLEVEEPLTCIFKHIVIRDVAYNTLLMSGREDLHLRLAYFLESKARDNPAESAGILAYHFLAGSEVVKGLEYTLVAARNAKNQYANQDAIHHYRRALELLTRRELKDRPGNEALLKRVKQELAEALLQAGDYSGSIQLFEDCLQFPLTTEERSEIHIGLGRVYQEKGESTRAIAELEQALMLLGRRAPRSLAGLGVRILYDFTVHLLHSVFPWILPPLPEQRRPRYLKQFSTLLLLIKIYYFVDINKLTWATLLATNMADRLRTELGWALANAYLGSLFFGAGLLKRSGQSCERGVELARRTHDSVVEATALCRLGVQRTFANDLENAVRIQEQAAAMFRQIGEMWERQTSLMLLATSHFLASRFETAERIYAEMGNIGVEINARMFEAWSYSWVPFCRYLLGRSDSAAVYPELERAHRISVEVNDLANQCAALNHIAVVAVREEDPERAAQAAVRAFESIWKYHVLVPFLQIGLVHAAEAALYALEQGATAVPRAKLLRIVRLASFKARMISKLYPYLPGPAMRVTARYVRLQRGPKEAEPLFAQAIALLEKSPNRWETGVACFDAAVALPHRREDLLVRAREMFLLIGAEAELRRVRHLEDAPLQQMQAS